MPDSAILDIAARENRILITMDKDFSELVFSAGIAHCGVLLQRLVEAASEDKIKVVTAILENYSEKLAGNFSVFQHGLLRIRE